MTPDRVHVLELKSELVRGGRRVAPRLRAEMDARGLTAKELAVSLSAWAAQDPTNRQPLDYRTIQNAMDGSCALETYFSLSGFLGWDFIEDVQTPVVGADPLTARELELARHQAQVAAVHARLVRERAARAAEPAAPDLGRGAGVPHLQLHRRSGSAGSEEAEPS